MIEKFTELVNEVSYKKTNKPFDFKMESLDTYDGRLAFRAALENMGL
jgi:hypothetical protein